MSEERIGLALGSGAARGWAHLGVLRALDEAGVQVDLVAGTSMGALVGAVFAAGRMEQLEEAARSMDWKTVIGLLDVRLPRSGLIDGTKIEAFVREHVRAIGFEELGIPFAAVATDMYAAEEVVLDQGDVIEAVRASISLPGVFTPVEKDGRFLVDGGLVNPVPVSVVRDMGAERVIAVDLNHTLMEKAQSKAQARKALEREREQEREEPSAWFARLRNSMNERAARVHPALAKEIGFKGDGRLSPSIYEVLGTTISIMEVRISEANLELARPDLLIRPALSDFNFMDFNRAQEAMDAGYEATRQALADLR